MIGKIKKSRGVIILDRIKKVIYKYFVKINICFVLFKLVSIYFNLNLNKGNIYFLISIVLPLLILLLTFNDIRKNNFKISNIKNLKEKDIKLGLKILLVGILLSLNYSLYLTNNVHEFSFEFNLVKQLLEQTSILEISIKTIAFLTGFIFIFREGKRFLKLIKKGNNYSYSYFLKKMFKITLTLLFLININLVYKLHVLIMNYLYSNLFKEVLFEFSMIDLTIIIVVTTYLLILKVYYLILLPFIIFENFKEIQKYIKNYFMIITNLFIAPTVIFILVFSLINLHNSFYFLVSFAVFGYFFITKEVFNPNIPFRLEEEQSI